MMTCEDNTMDRSNVTLVSFYVTLNTLNKLSCMLIWICVKSCKALINFFRSIYFNVLKYLLFFNKFSQIIT